MEKVKKCATLIFFATVLAAFLCWPCFAEDMITVTGTINDNYQLEMENGETYEIEVNDVGNEIMERIGEKVTVTGIVEEIDGIKTIIPESFEVAGETN